MRLPVGVLLAVTVLGGCSGTAEPAPTVPATTAPTTYELAPRTVRPDEVALRGEPVVEGSTSFSLIGLSTGMTALIGSHAEFEADGQFVRIRLVVVNVGRSGVLFDTKRQLLVLADGGTHPPHRSTMITKRQPDTFDLGAGVRVEFDLYYDVPVDAEPVALRAFGGGTLTDMKDEEGTDLPLEPVP
ncbi:DUF4352 domain-containing protein [Actinophytocola gossypii]|uniref:DUF4352 domain-containing protein n=1 Tax=Actinophytocola gossypii TaxID=2812003 RepID=A0ABT2JGY0_9PSEU|nr:DUF4352 domain-containing protein [Actinophytocola gossypii]MCT2587135.1 hypothetical protein [Actinophytocola gossypii]